MNDRTVPVVGFAEGGDPYLRGLTVPDDGFSVFFGGGD